ncbi:MAG: 16S rRNA processing protein RimM [Clostridia bacterium]|nr:16S rRNA processing protein RimM [Clostridia bacterium]
MDKFIDVGQIVNTHGLRGEVKVNPWTDAPEVFEAFDVLYTDDKKHYKVKGVRYQKNCVLLKLEGVDDMDAAERMRNKVLYAPRELFDELPEDTYLVVDIVGLTVKDDAIEYGSVEDVITTGSNDVYAVRTKDHRTILIPAIKDVINEINVKEGYIHITMPRGLLN